jgi:hypothetical protein
MGPEVEISGNAQRTTTTAVTIKINAAEMALSSRSNTFGRLRCSVMAFISDT